MASTYKLGRIHDFSPPPVPDLSTYVTTALPTPAASVNPPANNRTNWGMDGNDTWGDCTIAGADHVTLADATIASEPYQAPTLDQVKQTYFGLTGGADSGLVLSAVLRAWQTTGLFGTTLSAYAPVHVTNSVLLRQCIDFFGTAYVGVNLPKPAEGQFKTDGTGVWDLTGTAEDHDMLGGHCICLVGYDATHYIGVTWGATVLISLQWWARYADEAWATITQSFVERGGDARGINLATLQHDLASA